MTEELTILGGLEVTGYLAPSTVGKVYTRVELPRTFVPDVTLPGAFQLLDAPGGAAFAINKDDERVKAMTLRRDGKFTLVRVSEGAVGWISSSRIKPIQKPRSAKPDKRFAEFSAVEAVLIEPTVLDSAGNRISKDQPETLPKDTPMFDAVQGRFVGAATEGFRYRPAKQGDGWARYDIPTRCGIAALWA